MKRAVVLVMVGICLLSLCACGGKGALGLYILSAEQVKDSMSAREIGALAAQEGRLALNGQDFVGVDWENQYFAVDAKAVPSVSTVTAEHGGCSLLKTTDEDVFVWVLNGKALYVGGFEMGSSNPATPRSPYIQDKERYTFAIAADDRYGEDLRFNKALYNWFYKAGLIKSELS